MSLALIDCPTGLAGDMLLAALLDLGVPETVIQEPLAALGLAGRYRLRIREERRGGLRGLHVQVETLEDSPPSRAWGPLRRQLEEAPLEPELQRRVLAVFGLLAEAEAAVHGHAPDQVHFHEVGAVDALVDIVGVCAALLHLEVATVICGIPPAGHGRVVTAHGSLPLPAPAVLEIARRRGVPLAECGDFPAGELTTPTGLALVACWATAFAVPPTAVPLRIGTGLGSRHLDRPNLLRITLARPVDPVAAAPAGQDAIPAEGREPLLLQQAQIDDATAEELAFLGEELRRAGAVEVFSQPLTMKKGRQGTLLSALLPPALGPALRQVWWRHSTTLGLREQLHWRWLLPRREARVDTRLGPVRLKCAALPDGGSRRKAEYDDLADLARRHRCSLAEVRALVESALAEDRSADRDPPELP
jgi:hypothetical protein